MALRTIQTQCVISGGGPAGLILGYLLARSGTDVVVLEKWPDFFRDFRGDTIHPSTMEMLKELGLFEKFLKLPFNKTERIAVQVEGEEFFLADFTHIKSAPPFVAFIPQWDFLNFIAQEAKQFPNFHLMLETEVVDVVKENGQFSGIRATHKDEEIEIRADLVVGADGRHSTIREKAGLTSIDSGAPIDVLWFKMPQEDDGSSESLGYVSQGSLMVLLDRDDYWQCALAIPKGEFEQIKKLGIASFREKIVKQVPMLQNGISELKNFDDVKLLSVSVNHLKKWHQSNLICIGDSAHAMSPVGGVGINLAIQDAVAAANILAPAFKRPSGIVAADLEKIQKRRLWPARVVQKIQIFIHTRIISPTLASTKKLKLPWQFKMLKRFPALQRIPAWVIGIGIRPEHVSKFIKDNGRKV